MTHLDGIDDVIKNLEKALLNHPENEVRKIGIKASKPIVEAARAKAPVSSGTHYYINSNGDKVSFAPGNLARSIRVIRKFRNDPRSVYVGPRIVAKNASGTYAGSRVNAYYGHFVEYGTTSHKVGYGGKKGATVSGIVAQPYMRPAWDSMKSAAMKIYMRLLEELVFKSVPTNV